jgi:hypothetical protein
MSFRFRVLQARRLPAAAVTVVAAELLEGKLSPGVKAVATIAGQAVVITVRSVALEGGRAADGSVTLEVVVPEHLVSLLKGAVFSGTT